MKGQSRHQSQRGAIIIHVALALMALLAFTVFVVDYGVMWVSRREAQNAADAGALGGAISLMKDGGSVASFTLTCPSGSTTPACQSARHWANNNLIFGYPNSDANVDVTLSGTGSSIPPCDTQPGCVRVDVYRNMPRRPERGAGTAGTPIPTFFSPLAGIAASQQGVRATATARAQNGANQVECIIPFATIDRWADNYDENKDDTYFKNPPDSGTGTNGWSPNDKFQPTPATGCGAAPCDVYVPPYNGNTNHTGWKVTVDLGRQLIMKAGSTGNYSSGWALQVDLPESTGSSDYNWNIKNCNTRQVGIATASEPCTAVNEPIGCLSVKTGMAQGPTQQGIIKDTDSVVAQDPLARWDAATQTVVGGQGMSSPRIRPLVIIDINHYIAQGCSGTGCIGKVANIIGFFVEGMCKDVAAAKQLDPGMVCPDPTKDVVGRILNLPAQYTSGVGTVEGSASFLQILQLVR